MISWRGILKASTFTQFTQNPQKPLPRTNFEYFEDIEERNSSQKQSMSTPAVPNSGSEPVYCERCGGGYWIRETFGSFFQCGRCSPSDTRVETLFIPGGTPLPKSPVQAIGSNRDIIIEPAAPNARAIYWETGTSRILGPATPEFLARDGETFWVVTTFEGRTRWVNADQLRSKRNFERQAEVQEVHIVREDHR